MVMQISQPHISICLLVAFLNCGICYFRSNLNPSYDNHFLSSKNNIPLILDEYISLYNSLIGHIRINFGICSPFISSMSLKTGDVEMHLCCLM